MNRLDQLYQKLGLNKQNGLYFLDEWDKWIHKFPYRIGRILKEVIKPEAFFCLYNDGKLSQSHPQPFNQGFIFFFDNPSESEEEQIHSRVINFGLAQAVFINRPNTLDSYHGTDFFNKTLRKLLSSQNLNDFSNFTFSNQIVGNTIKSLGYKKDTIDTFLLNNITDVRRILIAPDGMKLLPQAANRIIGRLLFISYLIDRDVTFGGQTILLGDTKLERKVNFRNIISNKTKLYAFFKYLNAKYDGDMFPLKEYEKGKLSYDEESLIQSQHLILLSHLFNCSEVFQNGKAYNGYFVQPSLFNLYDFEIIPVELISSIYENFIGSELENGQINLSKQKEIKAYYTPAYIVDYVLSQTVSPFLERRSKTDSNCRVLDPSCGSGIFLVETLRKIIEKERIHSEKNKITDAKLWKLINDNIFGIDIDSDAIDITIFSLYVTILDYKQPAEIENFKFKKLKDVNLFAGQEADFFNTKHIFNTKLNGLDFIIGNPPWGTVESSCYLQYISDRNDRESIGKKSDDIIRLRIGDKEICQAFLVRTSDFISNDKPPFCCFVVSSKVFYNTNASSKEFRNYFLQRFSIKQVVELSPVNNKIRGGNHIFDHARQPAAIISFLPQKKLHTAKNSVIQHITAKPNKFFKYYKTIVVEKHDVKNIKQEYFMPMYGGFDWLWKVLVHGNILDIHFLKRLKSNETTIGKYLNTNGYVSNGGLKLKDGSKKYETTQIQNFDYLDGKGFKPYQTLTTKKWKKYIVDEDVKDGKVGYLPDISFFKGEKLLIKKGIVLEPSDNEHHFQAVSAFNENNICFTSTVCSIKSTEATSESKIFLTALSALINSELFTYFLLNTSSSAGIERSRIHFAEFFEFPLLFNSILSELALSVTNKFNQLGSYISDEQTLKKIRREIEKLYKLSDTEKALIQYAHEVAIPVLLREEQDDVFEPLKISDARDKKYLSTYVEIMVDRFESRFSAINKILIPKVSASTNFIRIDFKISSRKKADYEFAAVDSDNLEVLVGDLGIYSVCKDLYFQQDVRGFTDSSFYIIKPNEKKVWHSAIAYLDALEFEEEITKAEIQRLKKGLVHEGS